MAVEPTLTPEEYGGDVELVTIPRRLREVGALTAMIAIFMLAIVLDFAWKRSRRTTSSPAAGKMAVSEAT
jgi:hypothetical protein